MSYYVYVIQQVNSRYVKIGVSNDPIRRLISWQRFVRWVKRILH